MCIRDSSSSLAQATSREARAASSTPPVADWYACTSEAIGLKTTCGMVSGGESGATPWLGSSPKIKTGHGPESLRIAQRLGREAFPRSDSPYRKPSASSELSGDCLL